MRSSITRLPYKHPLMMKSSRTPTFSQLAHSPPQYRQMWQAIILHMARTLVRLIKGDVVLRSRNHHCQEKLVILDLKRMAQDNLTVGLSPK